MSKSNNSSELEIIIRQNGNQAAPAMADFVHEQGGGGSTIEGEAGQVVVCDGNGGAAGSSKLVVNGDGVTSAKGDISAESNINADGNISAKGNIVAGGDLILGGKSNAQGIYLHDTTDPTMQYYVTITNGQLTATLVG